MDSAPRLYVEALNDMFDAQSSRVYALTNRVPTAVLALEVAGAAIAVAALALHLATFGRGLLTVLTVSLLVAILLVVTFDLDRPTRGVIDVPSTPLLDVRAGMAAPPAAEAPAAGDPYSSTVTSVKGRCGSTHGKTTNSSSAQTASTSSSEITAWLAVRRAGVARSSRTSGPPSALVSAGGPSGARPCDRRRRPGRRG